MTREEVQDYIRQTAIKYGVHSALALAIAKQESGYEHYWSDGSLKVSSAGAIGVMQLMPETAAGLGVDPSDIYQNIDGGIRYLKAKLDEFGGNVTSAIASYNAGSGAVRKYDGVPPYKETQDYVASIEAMLGDLSEFPGLTGVTNTTPTNQPIIPGGELTASEELTLWEKVKQALFPAKVDIKGEITAREWIKNKAAEQGIPLVDSFKQETESVKNAWKNSPAGQSDSSGNWFDLVKSFGNKMVYVILGIAMLIIGLVLMNGKNTVVIREGGSDIETT